MPLVKGHLALTGCRLTALGVTWRQPWLQPAASGQCAGLPAAEEAGGQVQVPASAAHQACTRCTPNPLLSAADWGLAAQARVSVVDPLPLMEARLDIAATHVSSADALHALPAAGEASKGGEVPLRAAATDVTSLRGQVLQCRLIAANAGMPLTRLGAVNFFGLQAGWECHWARL